MKNQHIKSERKLPPKEFKGKFFGCKMGKIFIKTKSVGDTPVLDIRGWGYLTGEGALGLDEDTAAKIQDQFEEWVIDTLNEALTKK